MLERHRIFVSLSTIALFGTLLVMPETASAAVNESMRSFVTKLVPVLFPYMVLSHFFVTYRLLDPFAKCLGLGEDIGAVFLMGQLCGYPMGAKMTKEMVERGRLDPKKAAMLCAFSSGASPAFLIHGVGSALWNSTRYGIFLLAIQFTSSLIALWVWQKHSVSEKYISKTDTETISFVECFCHAVRESTQQTLTIGGFIVFFHLLVAVLTTVFSPYSEKLTPFLSALLEFSTGTKLAAEAGGYGGLFCTGLAVGFGGLSVLAQTAHLLVNTDISLRPYGIWKLLCGILMGLLSMVWGSVEPELLTIRHATGSFHKQGSGIWLIGYLAILVMMWHTDVHRREQRQ